jgi:uncharacterized protein
MSGPAVAAFAPRFPWYGGDLQTLATRFARVPALPGKAVEFAMADGDVLTGILNRQGGPLALLLHGLAGSARSIYMRRTALALQARGFDTLCLDWRGAGHGRAKASYHAGRSADLAEVLALLPPGPVVAVGFSLGANILLKYLGEAGAASRIQKAVAVSAPIDLAATSARMHARRNRFYHDYLLQGMKATSPYAAARDRAIATIRDFDDHIVAPNNGFADAASYYAKCSARIFMPRIAVPTLLVHAMDDPWIPGALYRDYPWAENLNLTPLLTAGGGHVGFHERGQILARHDRAAIDFFAA